MRTPALLAILTLSLALAGQPARAQLSLLAVDAEVKGDPAVEVQPGDTEGEIGAEIGAPKDGGRVDAAAPAVRYEWVRTTRSTAAPRDFSMDLDTPAFGNFSVRTRGSGQYFGMQVFSNPWSGGTCYGLSLLVSRWVARVVAPVVNGQELNNFTAENTLVITANRGNLGDHRMRAFSGANRDLTVHAAVDLHRHQAHASNAGRVLEHAEFLRTVTTEITDAARQTAFITLYGPKGFAHAMLVRGVEEGIARPVGGTADQEVEAIRFRLFDSNFASTDAANDLHQGKPQLIYFPSTGRYTFGREHATPYGEGLQAGAYYTYPLKYHDVHGLAARSIQANPRIASEIEHNLP